MFLFRNTAVESVKQELLFVGSESGKLLALRNLMQEVLNISQCIFICMKIIYSFKNSTKYFDLINI